MFIITTRKQFSESARRLAKAFTLKTAINMVTRALRNSERHALAESLSLAFEGKFNNERMGLPQANDLLATALSGQDQNVTAKKLKSNKSIDSTICEETSRRIQSHATNLNSLAFTMCNQSSFIQSIKSTFESASDSLGIEEKETPPSADGGANTSAGFIGFILYILRHANVVGIETDGMTSFKTTSYGVREYSREIRIKFESATLSMHFEWKESEYETDEVYISTYINGTDADDYLIGNDPDGNFSIDNFQDFMGSIHTSEFVQQELDADFIDVSVQCNKDLLPIAEYLANL
jgi:hypothetical protein